MKIAIDARYAEDKLTGIGQYIEKLSLALDKNKHEVFLFYSRNPKVAICGKRISKVVLPCKNRYLFEQFLLPLYLKKENFDLYHAAGNIGVPFFCPVPVVLTVHDIIPLVYSNYFVFSRFPLISKTSFLVRTLISLHRAKVIITDSKFTKDCIIKKFLITRDKIKVIPLAVDPINTNNKLRLPKEIEKNEFIINNGGIDVRKNLFRAIEAFSKILIKFPKLKMVITGENPTLMPKLKDYAKRLKVGDSVYFSNYVSEKILWRLVKKAICLCYPTEVEGFGLPVLIAMRVGTPVITSNCSSLPEVVGDAAILVDPFNVDDIANALEMILTNKVLRRDLTKKGFAQAKRFKWSNTVDETIHLYYKALE
jgi:glycosyltransferase involved in cell wall biosynthesis